MTWTHNSRLTGSALSVWRCLTRERKKKGLEEWRPSVLFGINFSGECIIEYRGGLKEPPLSPLAEVASLSPRLSRTERNMPEQSWGQRPTWIQIDSTSMSSEIPCGASVSGASGPPGLAATAIIGAPWNLEQKNKSCHS